MTGADSYRGIRTFINGHRERLNAGFGIAWKRAPAHTAIRYILQNLNPADVETSARFSSCLSRDMWTPSTETALYLSMRPITADLAAEVVRGHWGIENRLPDTRDVTLREDASRIRSNPGIFARLRSFAYTLLRFNQSDTIPQDRYAAALGGLQALASMTSHRELNNPGVPTLLLFHHGDNTVLIVPPLKKVVRGYTAAHFRFTFDLAKTAH